MRPTEIELQKISNKLNTLIKFFTKELEGVRYNEKGINVAALAIKKALAHGERIGWIKGE